MMEWLTEDIETGQRLLMWFALGVAAAMLWFGRKKLSITVPIIFLFLLVAGVVIPSALPARPTAQRNVCIRNLGMIQDAKQDWMRTHETSSEHVFTRNDLIGSAGRNGLLRDWPVCPRGGVYTIGPAGHTPTCSLADKGHVLE